MMNRDLFIVVLGLGDVKVEEVQICQGSCCISIPLQKAEGQVSMKGEEWNEAKLILGSGSHSYHN